MKLYKFVGTLLLLLALVAIGPRAEEKGEDLRQLKQTIADFYRAVNSGDIEKRLSLFAADAIIMPNQGKLIRFNEKVKDTWRKSNEDWIFRIKDITHVDIQVCGDLAYTINTYYYTFHRKGSEPVWHDTKNLHIWEKDGDSSWKLRVDIWNSSKTVR